MPLILPSSWTAQGNKDGQKHVTSLRPGDNFHWCSGLAVSKKLHNDLSMLHVKHGIQKSLTKGLKSFHFINFFCFFPAVFSIKAPKALDAYDAVPNAQANTTRHLMCISTIRREHLLLWNVFQPFKEGFLHLGVISQTIRGVDLCVELRVPWFHMLATLIVESKHL